MKPSPITLLSWGQRWKRWVDRLPGHDGFFSEIFLAGFYLVRPGNAPSAPLCVREELFKALRRTLADLFRKAFDPNKASHLDIPVCPDVFLFCHVERGELYCASERLAERLAKKGFNVVLWTANQRQWLLPRSPRLTADVQECENFVRQECSGLASLGCLARSFVQTLWVSIRFRSFGIEVASKPSGLLWSALLESGFRRLAARRILSRTTPRLILATHERFSPAAEFILASAEFPEVTRALYHHGLASPYDFPVLSDELLAWNSADVESLRASCPSSDNSFYPVGNLEFERVRNANRSKSKRSIRSQSKPTLVFFSQWLDAEDPALLARTRIAARWLRFIVEQTADWNICVKPRDAGDQISHLTEFKRWPEERLRFCSPEMSVAQAVEEATAACGLCSSALYVAAGLGTPTLRFLPRGESSLRVLDDVTQPVCGPFDLLSQLRAISSAALMPAEARNWGHGSDFPRAASENLLDYCVTRLGKAGFRKIGIGLKKGVAI